MGGYHGGHLRRTPWVDRTGLPKRWQPWAEATRRRVPRTTGETLFLAPGRVPIFPIFAPGHHRRLRPLFRAAGLPGRLPEGDLPPFFPLSSFRSRASFGRLLLASFFFQSALIHCSCNRTCQRLTRLLPLALLLCPPLPPGGLKSRGVAKANPINLNESLLQWQCAVPWRRHLLMSDPSVTRRCAR